MVDFGANKPERPLSELVTSKLRPGDIYTHMYSGLRGEQDASGKVNPALWQARKRGVLFDVGHGQTSFAWRIAVPAIKEGWLPDVISTDLHVASMSGGMKDMPNVMSKFLALGLPFDEIDPADHVERGSRGAAGRARPPEHRSERRRRGLADRERQRRARRRSRHGSQGLAAGRCRADAAQWQGCLRPEWAVSNGVGAVTKNEKAKNEKRLT